MSSPFNQPGFGSQPRYGYAGTLDRAGIDEALRS